MSKIVQLVNFKNGFQHLLLGQQVIVVSQIHIFIILNGGELTKKVPPLYVLQPLYKVDQFVIMATGSQGNSRLHRW